MNLHILQYQDITNLYTQLLSFYYFIKVEQEGRIQ